MVEKNNGTSDSAYIVYGFKTEADFAIHVFAKHHFSDTLPNLSPFHTHVIASDGCCCPARGTNTYSLQKTTDKCYYRNGISQQF